MLHNTTSMVASCVSIMLFWSSVMFSGFPIKKRVFCTRHVRSYEIKTLSYHIETFINV